MNIPYTQDLTDCFAGEIGDGGLDAAQYEKFLDGAGASLGKLRKAVTDGSLPFLGLPGRRKDIPQIQAVADRYSQSFADVVVLGTGGSSLGGRTLYRLSDGRPSPRLHFMDNVDPDSFETLIGELDWTKSGILAISKSGSTAETLTQLGVLTATLRDHVSEAEIPSHLTIVTEPTDNPLMRIANLIGCEVLEHDTDIGGRYSALSVTGLLPASIAGLKMETIRGGASAVLEETLNSEIAASVAPAAGAAVSIGLNRSRGISATVLMPYCDRLADLGLWYCQLWAESLGKQGEGTTPVRAIGAVDQHSQLQLYLDGPKDKMFSLVLTDTLGTGPAIPADFAGIDGLSYLKDRTMGDLLAAEGRATAETLANNGRPTRVFNVPTVDEASMGALMMHFMLETTIAADLIGVDAFDQPAVEEGKILTREYLGKGRMS